MRRTTVLSGMLLPLALLAPFEAHATFPGSNGKIAVSTNADGDFEVATINQDGSGLTPLTNNSATDFQAAWSPDGTKIAFQSNRDGNFEIYVMNQDGSGQTRLTNNPANDASPAWSPSGAKIVFSSNRDGNTEIYVMNADGSAPTRLTNNPALDIVPRWSPDDSKIAFTSNRDGNFEVYSMGTDGSAQTNLSQNAANDFASSWYPNGSRLAYSSNRDGNFNVYTMHANGSGQTRITDHAAADTDPAFSPDGSEITFDSERGGTLGIWRIELTLPLARTSAEADPATEVIDGPGTQSGGGESQQPVDEPENLSIEKRADRNDVAPGEEITWTITVRNLGRYALTVLVEERLDLNLRPTGKATGNFVECGDWSVTEGIRQSFCDLGDLASGEVRVIKVTSRLPSESSPAEVSNAAYVFIEDNYFDEGTARVNVVCPRSGPGSGDRSPAARTASLETGGGRTIRGTAKADTICGTNKANVILGRGGNDRIFGLGGDDALLGGGGKDKLVGGPGDDQCSQTGRSALKPCK